MILEAHFGIGNELLKTICTNCTPTIGHFISWGNQFSVTTLVKSRLAQCLPKKNCMHVFWLKWVICLKLCSNPHAFFEPLKYLRNLNLKIVYAKTFSIKIEKLLKAEKQWAETSDGKKMCNYKIIKNIFQNQA